MKREEAKEKILGTTVNGKNFENGIIDEMFDSFDKEKKDIIYDAFRNRKTEDIVRELYLLIDGDNDLYEVCIGLYKYMDKTYKQELKEEILES